MQPVSSPLLEQLLFSKQTFDPEGMIVACRNGRPIGFAHGGFGPSDDGSSIDYSMGATQMLMTLPTMRSPELIADLLAASEEYLRSRGAKVLYGGGMRPLDGFYLGLYGGSELSGVLESDRLMTDAFQQSSYEVAARALVLHHELSRHRPAVSREQRLLKRETQFQQNFSPAVTNWWDANRLADADRQVFRLTPRRTLDTLARVEFWDIEPLATRWGIRTAGLRELHVPAEHRRRKLASFLLNESFKTLRKRGVALLEAHVMQDNEPALNLYRGMDFTQVDTGVVFRKPGGTA
ncbi:GNAT family N-acetyltransferase [Posidoniimonas polymericola]|uniref:GNAT family N-acetyltransferase n=1 Tax=Posidoniimonas polymericola TaxID=2528002 RepID=UPI0011B56852|nr:GNAT family N-acetyltransferase [Posidoniimonas polymericola]